MLIKKINTGNVNLVQGQSGCCPDSANEGCKHIFDIEDLASITSITIDGNVHTIVATDETDRGDITEAIENAFIAEGYVSDLNKEGIPDVYVYEKAHEDVGTAILIYTNAESVVLTTVPAATYTLACVKTVACRYRAYIPVGAGLSFEISDAEVEAANPGDSPQTISGDFATGEENALATEVQTEFEELYANTENITVKRVRVIENTATDLYEVDVWLYGRHTIETNNEDIIFEQCECKVDFTLANS